MNELHDHGDGHGPHTRAECAANALETALILLKLTGIFAAQRESFEPFREWARKAVADGADPAEAAESLSKIDQITPDDLRHATLAVDTFLAGFGGVMAAVPDEVLDGRVPPAFRRS